MVDVGINDDFMRELVRRMPTLTGAALLPRPLGRGGRRSAGDSRGDREGLHGAGLARMRELFDADDRDAQTTPIGVPHAD